MFIKYNTIVEFLGNLLLSVFVKDNKKLNLLLNKEKLELLYDLCQETPFIFFYLGKNNVYYYNYLYPI